LIFLLSIVSGSFENKCDTFTDAEIHRAQGTATALAMTPVGHSRHKLPARISPRPPSKDNSPTDRLINTNFNVTFQHYISDFL